MRYLALTILLAACGGTTAKKVETKPISPAMDAYLNGQAPDDPTVEEWRDSIALEKIKYSN